MKALPFILITIFIASCSQYTYREVASKEEFSSEDLIGRRFVLLAGAKFSGARYFTHSLENADRTCILTLADGMRHDDLRNEFILKENINLVFKSSNVSKEVFQGDQPGYLGKSQMIFIIDDEKSNSEFPNTVEIQCSAYSYVKLVAAKKLTALKSKNIIEEFSDVIKEN